MELKYRHIVTFAFIFCVLLSFQGFAQDSKGTVQIQSSSSIDDVIAQKKEYNKNLGTIKGYKIQLFYGIEKDAYDIRDEFKELFPEIKIKIIFSSPDWKVQIGNYKTRLEADNALLDVKSEFPDAIIFATDIEY